MKTPQVYEDNTTLVIEQADLQNSGVYKVLASNDAGVAEFAFTVIVGTSSVVGHALYHPLYITRYISRVISRLI